MFCRVFLGLVLVIALGTGGAAARPSGLGLVERGQALLSAGNVAGACAAFEAASDSDRSDARAPYLLGMAYARAGRDPYAIEHAYREAISRDPRFALAHARLGQLLFGLRHTVEAQDQLQAALALAPDLAEAHFDLGCLFRSQNRPDEAVIELSRAVTLAPKEARFRLQLGDAYWQNRELTQAAAELRQANKLRPRTAVQWSHLGSVLVALKDEAGARTSFETAIRLDPSTVPALEGLAQLEEAHGHLAAVVSLLYQARRYASEDTAIGAALCATLTQLESRPGPKSRALQECRAAAQERAQDPAPRLHLVELFAAKNDCAEARTQLAALAAIPQLEPSWVPRGQALVATCIAVDAPIAGSR